MGQVTFTDAGFTERRWMIDPDGLGDDQTGFTFSAALIIAGYIFARYAVGAVITGHRCHDDTIFQT
ncbi:hypothetical protein D3C80_2010100 [compost metagenome]